MKIRTDFVTNSSSSSFILSLNIELTNGEEIIWMGVSDCEGGYEYNELAANKSPKELGNAKSIDELVKLITNSIGEIKYDDDYCIQKELDPILSDKNKIVDRIKKLKTMDEIKKITIEGYEDTFDDYDGRPYAKDEIISYDLEKKQLSEIVYGENENLECEGNGGQLLFYKNCKEEETPDGWFEEKRKNAFDEAEKFDDTIIKNNDVKEDVNNFIIEDGVLKKYNGSNSIVLVPEGVVEIGDHVFYGNKNLVSIELPESLKSIGDEAFYNCKNLSSIKMFDSSIDSGIRSFGEGDEIGDYPQKLMQGDYFIVGTAIAGYIGEEESEITIPDFVTAIRNNSFAYHEELEKIHLSKKTNFIGYNAFSNCLNLKELYIPSNDIRINPYQVFGYKPERIIEQLTIYGVKGSSTEKYCIDNNIKFKEL